MDTKLNYRPTISERLLRNVASLLLFLLRVDGRTKWGNEFIQQANPVMNARNPIDKDRELFFRTGHGRLFWRVKNTPNIEPETNEWLNSLHSNDVLVDIGSNIGLYSLMAAQAKGIQVLSFEMEPLNYSLQHENIFFNHLDSLITLFPIALSDETSLRKVFFKSISPGDALHSVDMPSPLLDTSRAENSIERLVPTFSLDDFLKHFPGHKPSVIKLDVDGCELKILRGATKTLAYIRELMVEVDKHSENEIIAFLLSKGFVYLRRYPSHSKIFHNYNILFSKGPGPLFDVQAISGCTHQCPTSTR